MCNVSNDKWGAGGGGSGQKDLYHLMMWEAGLQKIVPITPTYFSFPCFPSTRPTRSTHIRGILDRTTVLCYAAARGHQGQLVEILRIPSLSPSLCLFPPNPLPTSLVRVKGPAFVNSIT